MFGPKFDVLMTTLCGSMVLALAEAWFWLFALNRACGSSGEYPVWFSRKGAPHCSFENTIYWLLEPRYGWLLLAAGIYMFSVYVLYRGACSFFGAAPNNSLKADGGDGPKH